MEEVRERRWRQRRKGEGGSREKTPKTPPPPQRRALRLEEGHEAIEGGEEMEAEEEEERHEEEGYSDRETPRGAPVKVTRVGGGTPPPQRKTQTSQDSPKKVCTYCCRKSMETYRITTTGHTWTGESWTTLYGSVIGARSLLSQRAGMPLPLEWWGAASRKSWLWDGGGFSK